MKDFNTLESIHNRKVGSSSLPLNKLAAQHNLPRIPVFIWPPEFFKLSEIW